MQRPAKPSTPVTLRAEPPDPYARCILFSTHVVGDGARGQAERFGSCGQAQTMLPTPADELPTDTPLDVGGAEGSDTSPRPNGATALLTDGSAIQLRQAVFSPKSGQASTPVHIPGLATMLRSVRPSTKEA